MCALAFCKHLHYTNNIDLLWEDLVFLSFCLHTTSAQHLQNETFYTFDSSLLPNFLLFQHGRRL